MPIGHFVTRAFAYMLQKTLKPGQTAADLPGMGSPNGFDLEDFLGSLSPSSDGVAGLLLNYVADEAGMPKDTQIILPGGEVVTYADAYPVYADLFSRWADRWDSELIAWRAACADQWGIYLGWFAQRLAIEQASNLVIFGHTHQPVSGLTTSPVNAINSGYECVSIPDAPPKEFTLTLVDLDTASGRLLQIPVNGEGDPQFFPALPQPPVARLPGLPPTADCSCYITIINKTGATLTRDPLPAPTLGTWIVEPPEQVAPGATATAWLQSDYDAFASDSGTFSYNGASLKFWSLCSALRNECTGPANNFVTRAGTSGWSTIGVVAQGHPLQIKYAVG